MLAVFYKLCSAHPPVVFCQVPFTAFKDRSFYHFAEECATIYILLRDEKPGAFALEMAEMKVRHTLRASRTLHGDGRDEGVCNCRVITV